MAVNAFLGGLVVVRRNLKRRIRAEFLRLAGQLDGFRRGVGAGSSDDPAAAGGEFDHPADHFEMFFAAQGRRLPGGADRHQPGHTPGDLQFDNLTQRIPIDLSVAERGDQRRVNAFEFHHFVKLRKIRGRPGTAPRG